MGYASKMLAHKPMGMCYHIWDAIRERHFRHNPAPDDETYWQRVLALSPGEQAIILAFRFSEQVHDGGFIQFFDNGGFRYARATAEGLERLGFSERAKFLRRAIKIGQIPNPVPPDYCFGSPLPEEGGVDYSAAFGDFDTQFYNAYTNRDWDKVLLDYVRTHPEEFV